MGVIKIRGIILRETPAGESDKRLLVLAKEHGKMLLFVRGARKPKSKYLSGSEAFTYCDFYVYPGRGFYSVTQIDVLEKFFPIRQDIIKLAYACYFSEILEKTLWEAMEADEILLLLLRALALMARGGVDPGLAARVFQIKYLQIAGFGPERERAERLSPDAKRAVYHILDSSGAKAFAFGVSPAVAAELRTFTRSLFDEYIGERFKTLEFAENLENPNLGGAGPPPLS